jgi:hypothetical protein
MGSKEFILDISSDTVSKNSFNFLKNLSWSFGKLEISKRKESKESQIPLNMRGNNEIEINLSEVI